jgi:hypothetical protein
LCPRRGDDRDSGVLWLGTLEGFKIFLARQTWRLKSTQ